MRPLLFTRLLLFFVSPASFAQTEEPLQLDLGSLVLDGTLTRPANEQKPVPVLLLIAGSGPTDRNCNSAYGLKTDAFKMLTDSLVRQGIAVARYDKRGVGQSKAPGTVLARSTFDTLTGDAMKLVRKLQADRRFSEVIIAGHSEGSLIGMLAARQTNTRRFISIAGSGRNAAELIKSQLSTLPDTLRKPSYVVLDSLKSGHLVRKYPVLLYSLFNPALQPYMISWMKYDPAVELKKYGGAVLLINGRRDVQVPVSEAELLKAARPDARLVLPDEMNHILKNAPADRADNLKTYTDPTLPLSPGLATAIAQFIKQ